MMLVHSMRSNSRRWTARDIRRKFRCCILSFICLLACICCAMFMISSKLQSVKLQRLQELIPSDLLPPTYVWKFGIALHSDKHDDIGYLIAHIFPDRIYNISKFTNIQHGDLVWLKAEQLPDFTANVLPYIDHYFTLIIASNSDFMIPLHAEHTVFTQLLHNKYILYIFSENYDMTLSSNTLPADYRKLEAIPLGLDFHTGLAAYLLADGSDWHGNHHSVEQQEAAIDAILFDQEQVLKTEDNEKEKSWQIYLDSAFLQTYGDEEHLKRWNDTFGAFWKPRSPFDILAAYDRRFTNQRREMYRAWVLWRIEHDRSVNRSLFYIDQEEYTQYDGWRKRGEFRFALSLFGNGLDCHRTYEALLFGNIVITQTSPMDAMFRRHDLPVVIVNDFSEINATMLRKWYREYQPKLAVTRYRLTNKYWINYMRKKTATKLKTYLG